MYDGDELKNIYYCYFQRDTITLVIKLRITEYGCRRLVLIGIGI